MTALTLSALVLCLLALTLAVTQMGLPFVPRWLGLDLLAYPQGRSCKYALQLRVSEPPRFVRRVWNVRLGDALNDFGMRTYQDPDAAYLRLGLYVDGVECVAVP